MDIENLILISVTFTVLMLLVAGTIIFFLRRTLILSTEGALQRLNEEITKVTEKQNELSNKLQKSDEELKMREKEAKELAEKMRVEAEEEIKTSREKIIAQAREEGEEIIAKAHGAKDKIREELERDMDVKLVRFSMNMLNDVLSDKAKGSLNKVLVEEFINNFQTIDMNRISSDVKSVEVVMLEEADSALINKFKTMIKERLERDIDISIKVDKEIGGGVIMMFGSMALDGSVKNLIREAGTNLTSEIVNK